MSERKLVVDHLKLTYDGLFNITMLYRTIDNWFMENGFDKREVRNQEHLKPDGKYIEIELQPWKKITDYARHVIKVQIKMLRIQDVEVEQDGLKVKVQKGRVNIIFDSYLDTDYEGRWEMKPFYFFLRTVFDKFVYRTYTSQFEDLLVEKTSNLFATIKAFLNLHKYEFGVAVRASDKLSPWKWGVGV
ncbi:MAG: hypothetical protein GY861_14830 [bacterium]|nr:hypothetical protein [bacterium]